MMLSLSTMPVEAATADTAVMPLIEISMADSDPLDTLKKEVIKQRAEDTDLVLSTVDIGASKISVDHFNQSRKGLSQVTVNIILASKETETDGDERTLEPSMAYSFSETITLSIKESAAPQILLTESFLSLNIGDEFIPESHLSYVGDSSNVLPAVTIENWVDTSAAGTYWCHYMVTNQLGKQTSAYLRVDVEDPTVTAGNGAFAGIAAFSGAYVDGSVYGMLDAINAVRTSSGLFAYSMADTAGLTAASVRASEASYYLSHTRPNGTSYSTAFDEQGVGHGFIYECLVAYGSSIDSNLSWWLNEPGHARIILGSSGSTIAIGYSNGVWVADVY